MIKYRYTLEIFFFENKMFTASRGRCETCGQATPKNRPHTPQKFRRKLWGFQGGLSQPHIPAAETAVIVGEQNMTVGDAEVDSICWLDSHL